MNNFPNKTGLIIAAPCSGSGKTVFTLALLRALYNTGTDIASAKIGPDFIDPSFHQRASSRPCINLDPWAMTPERLQEIANKNDSQMLLIEAAMGLFDGAGDGAGTAADLAQILRIPIILVIDCMRQSHSIAALAQGFRDHRTDIKIAGVVLNKVGSLRHEKMLRDALGKINMPVFGAIHRTQDLIIPERHLGLKQAEELDNIAAFIDQAGEIITANCDCEAIVQHFAPLAFDRQTATTPPLQIKPLGQRIAIAKDIAFSFIYPHILEDWRLQGAEISYFSPLQDEAPDATADAIYLPGGYPELHGATLAQAGKFKNAMQIAAANATLIYGECGGYMVLGEHLIDTHGNPHAMLDLLGVITSFEQKKRHLGYRALSALHPLALGNHFMAHEFHYTTLLKEEGEALFAAKDALGNNLGSCGLRRGTIMGSYMHLIDGVLS